MDNVIVVGILVNAGKVLLVRRRAAEGTLAWQFPGGAVEPPENQMQAIEREVLEELGIECRARQNLGQRVHPETGRTVAYWCCDALTDGEGILDHEELSEYRWLSPAEAFHLITTDLFEPVRRYLTGLSDRASGSA